MKVIKVGDSHIGHSCDGFHTGVLVEGSYTVSGDSFAIGLTGDSFDCGDTISETFSTVQIDGRSIAKDGDLTNGHGCFPPTIMVGTGTIDLG